jgi:hypothetical protein
VLFRRFLSSFLPMRCGSWPKAKRNQNKKEGKKAAEKAPHSKVRALFLWVVSDAT